MAGSTTDPILYCRCFIEKPPRLSAKKPLQSVLSLQGTATFIPSHDQALFGLTIEERWGK
jgi:hypothetical protein